MGATFRVVPGACATAACALFLLLLIPAPNLMAHPGVEDRIHLLSEDIVASPNNQYLYVQRGLAYSNNAQPQLALADIKTAETLGDPLDVAFARGILLYRAGDFTAARVYFDRYLQAHPRHLASLEYRARMLRDAGVNAAALADFQQIFALKATPDPGYYISAARIMVALPEYGIDGAIALLDKRMDQVGVLSSLQRYAIELETDRQHYDAAITRMATLDKALRATPQWQVEVAQLHMQAGQPEQARGLLEQADSRLRALRSNTARVELQRTIQRLLQELGPIPEPIKAHDPEAG